MTEGDDEIDFMYIKLEANSWPTGGHINFWAWTCPDPKCAQQFRVSSDARVTLESRVLEHILGFHKYDDSPVYIGYRRKVS